MAYNKTYEEEMKNDEGRFDQIDASYKELKKDLCGLHDMYVLRFKNTPDDDNLKLEYHGNLCKSFEELRKMLVSWGGMLEFLKRFQKQTNEHYWKQAKQLDEFQEHISHAFNRIKRGEDVTFKKDYRPTNPLNPNYRSTNLPTYERAKDGVR